MSYLDELDDRLRDVGLSRSRRTRIIAEFREHLHDDPAAELGSPSVVASAFADQLGTSYARTATRNGFVALVVTALSLLVFAPVVATINQGMHSDTGFAIVMVLIFLGGQVALAAGGSAVLSALRHRGQRQLNRSQATALSRRASVGLAAGAVCTAGLALVPVTAAHQFSGTWRLVACVAAGLSAVALLLAVPAAVSAMRTRPTTDGSADDIAHELGVPLTSMQVALALSAAILCLFAIEGLVHSDPYDGAAQGLIDAAICMAGFMTLGTYLGLRRTG
jgi:hypothetical protein